MRTRDSISGYNDSGSKYSKVIARLTFPGKLSENNLLNNCWASSNSNFEEELEFVSALVNQKLCGF